MAAITLVGYAIGDWLWLKLIQLVIWSLAITNLAILHIGDWSWLKPIQFVIWSLAITKLAILGHEVRRLFVPDPENYFGKNKNSFPEEEVEMDEIGENGPRYDPEDVAFPVGFDPQKEVDHGVGKPIYGFNWVTKNDLKPTPYPYEIPEINPEFEQENI